MSIKNSSREFPAGMRSVGQLCGAQAGAPTGRAGKGAGKSVWPGAHPEELPLVTVQIHKLPQVALCQFLQEMGFAQLVKISNKFGIKEETYKDNAKSAQ